MAIAPDGSVWVADATAVTGGQSQNVYLLDKTGDLVRTTTVNPRSPDGGVRLSYVALQTHGDAVTNVWVSNNSDHAVAYFPPDATTAQSIDLGSDASPRGLLWDATNKLMWVADEATGNMYAIDVTQTPPVLDHSKVVAFGSEISMLAMAPGKIWATGIAKGAIFSFDLSKLGREGQGTNSYPLNAPDAEPFALQFGPDGKQLWFTTIANGYEALWTIDDVTRENPTPKSVQALGQGSIPQGLAVDKYGFVWVTLSNAASSEQNPLNLKGRSVCEFSRSGEFVSENAPLTANLFSPVSVIYRGYIADPIDDFWVSDQIASTQVFDFAPPDTGGMVIDYIGSPATGYAMPGQGFADPLSVKVTRHDPNALLRDLPIQVQIINADSQNNPAYANLAGGVVQKWITTGPTNGNPPGVAFIHGLTASSTAQANEGESFQLLGSTREQLNKPTSFFTGIIGNAPNVDNIKADDPTGVYTRVNKEFPKNLKVTLSGTNVGNVPVYFQIQSGSASFKAGSFAPADKQTSADTNVSGDASVALYALDTAGPVVVKASAGSRSTEFHWQVTPTPAEFQWATDYDPKVETFSDSGLWVRLLGAEGVPCSGEEINVAIIQSPGENKDATYFVHSAGGGKLKNDQYIGKVATDDNGYLMLNYLKPNGYALYFGVTGKVQLQATLVNEPPSNLDAMKYYTVTV
ncbi:Streptogramin lyase [Burkholderia pseudomallei]|nr:Streptogramin lyase [Burkholderia pseudomallei]CAK0457830.1 Streptogramin lyase [Burkholderia pseudomallei]